MDGTQIVGERDCRGLILSGGGARGAYQVGVLLAIGDELGCKVGGTPMPFDVVTGVSVGAINAAALVSRAENFCASIDHLSRLWSELRSHKVYRTDPPEVIRRLAQYLGSGFFGWAGLKAPQSLLNNQPLRDLLNREIDFDQLARNVEGETLDAIAITASSYEDGMSISYYHGSTPTRPWERSRRTGRPSRINAEHVMASAALPFVFPSISIDNDYFGDGALRQTAPLSPAVHLGCNKLFVIGARDLKIGGEPHTDHMPYPATGVIAGQLLDIVFNDNLEADVERLKRINATLEAMIPERRAMTDLRQIDVLTINPSEDIRNIAGAHAQEMPGTIKAALRTLGAFKAPWVLPSYLMFEPGYINALMDLGRRDAKARMDEIMAFLGEERTVTTDALPA